MSVGILEAGKNLAMPFTVPWTGAINYFVESQHLTTAFAVDANSLLAFRSGQQYTYWGNNAPQLVHRQQVIVPFRGTWYLVIVNYNPFNTAVYYNLQL